MLLCIMPGILAQPAAAYRCGQVLYTDSAGKPVTSLSGGAVLNASVTATPESGSAGKLMFAMLLYKNGTLTDVSSESKEVASETTFNAQLTIPSSTDGLSVVSVLWDNAVDMGAVCAASTLPSNNTALRGLKVNGAPLEGFESGKTSYTYEVSISETVKPTVTAIPADQGATVKYFGGKTFPGKTTVEVTSADGSSTAVYTVNYTTDKPGARGAKILNPDGTQYGAYDIGKNLHESDGGDINDADRLGDPSRLGSRVHWDRDWPVKAGYTNELRTISGAYKYLIGSDYIMSTAAEDRRANNGYATVVTLMRGAKLYVFADNADTCDGWTRKVNNDGFMTFRNNEDRIMRKLSTAHFDVANPDSGLEIKFPLETMSELNPNNGQIMSGPCLTVIEYDPYTTLPDNEEDGGEPVDPSPGPDDPTPPVEKSGVDSVEMPMYNGSIPSDVLRKNFTDRTYKPDKVMFEGTEYILGSQLHFWRDRPANATYTNDIVSAAPEISWLYGSDYIMCPPGPDDKGTVKFKLYEPATVAVVTGTGLDGAAAEADGWTYKTKSEGYMIAQNNETRVLGKLAYKHFDGAASGEQIEVPESWLKANGSQTGVYLVLIHYDKMGEVPEMP